jgi:hypothetical protein
MTALPLRAVSIVLFFAAAAIFWLAFTQFDEGPPPSRPSEAAAYEKAMMRHAQLSVLLGLAGSFVLLGAFACHSKATQAGAAPRPPDAP